MANTPLGSSHGLPCIDSSEYKHNLAKSHLHQLPAELLLQIGKYLSPDGIFAIRLVSRDLHTTFEPPLILGPLERDYFRALLRRDLLSWHSRWERFKGLVNLPKAVCSACKFTHPKSQFSLHQLSEQPGLRVCLGAENALKICQHRSFTLNEIRDAWLDNRDQLHSNSVFISKRSRASSPDGTTADSYAPSLEAIIGQSRTAGKCGIVRYFRLLILQTSKGLTAEDLAAPLSAIKETLCPQLTAVELPELRTLRVMRSEGKYGLCRSCRLDFVPCHGNNCSSKYSILRQQYVESRELDEVILAVYKDHEAPIWDLANPAWFHDLASRLSREQKTLNGKLSGKEPGTVLFKTNGPTEWSWSEV
ncbi:uncharacterized protein BDR25DRAFT_300964 [Lindgomyces ingoldianus]|uniref:Uncharacterized protein n=1 Tax=Lindgomyces ingoldianus TaxID=673940 RepID=A0ACB6R8K4_9PLEO|nr:uncharacterized protein BDR25DRAFT_300964 [Lindgomyces ingoldianus]KAF2475118.1 hypothetical protein BDR25DRAFT_300964 [Lindgomyces ingoldianus]